MRQHCAHTKEIFWIRAVWMHRTNDTLLQLKRSNSFQGFSLVEVMVAIMIALIFVSITMQVLVSAAVFRMRADQFDSAVNWIQEDLETVIGKAGRYQDSTKCNAINPADGFAAGFINDASQGLGGPSATFGPKQIGDKSLVLTRTAEYLPPPPPPPPASAPYSDPLRLVRLNYTVVSQGENKVVASMKTEVVPYAVLRC
jgi:prepilin-type N-terminal cleavage/methylation domain-containing protein